MLSCLKATVLVEKKLDHPLSFMENLQLAMHTSMCKGCSAYGKQSQILDSALKQPLNKEVVMIDLDKFKADIIATLNEG